MSVPLYESIAAVLLIFILPGFAISRALFPEWRFRGAGGTEHVIETVALSLTLSVSVTALSGFVLANSPGAGFTASWNDPVLQAILFGVTLVGLLVGYLRGAFRHRDPSAAPAPHPERDSDWATLREMDQMARERSHLVRDLRRARGNAQESDRLRLRLTELDQRMKGLRNRQESEGIAD